MIAMTLLLSKERKQTKETNNNNKIKNLMKTTLMIAMTRLLPKNKKQRKQANNNKTKKNLLLMKRTPMICAMTLLLSILYWN